MATAMTPHSIQTIMNVVERIVLSFFEDLDILLFRSCGDGNSPGCVIASSAITSADTKPPTTFRIKLTPSILFEWNTSVQAALVPYCLAASNVELTAVPMANT